LSSNRDAILPPLKPARACVTHSRHPARWWWRRPQAEKAGNALPNVPTGVKAAEGASLPATSPLPACGASQSQETTRISRTAPGDETLVLSRSYEFHNAL